MAKILKCDASVADAWVEIDLGSNQPEVWLTAEIKMDDFALADFLLSNPYMAQFWNPAHSTFTDYFSVYDVSNWQGGWGLGPPSPTGSDILHTIELRHVNGGNSTLYVDTIQVYDFSPESLGFDTRFITIGLINVSVTPASILYFDNIKVGTTRGANDIFGDDFDSGNLSAWTSTSGDVSVIDFTPPLAPVELDLVKFEWTIKHYDISGNPIQAIYTGYSLDETSEIVHHAFNRNLNFYLNGVDDCSFSLYLDDPMAYLITPLKSIIKVWRKITDIDGTVIYEDPANTPSFAGVVASAVKNGEENTMQIKAFNPMWRLQFHFHLLNHYLKTNPDTSSPWKQSELIWKLIDLINNAFPGTASFTGIVLGTFDWVLEPEVSPYFVAKGSNTWSNIFDDIMTRAAGSDIWPEYYHYDANSTLMIFNTFEKRGADKSATIAFSYHTTDANCDDLSEEVLANPGEFANYVWGVGQGGPNSGKVTVSSDSASGNFDYNTVGVYMKIVDRSEVKERSLLQKIGRASCRERV